jgi:hypothetical protein
MWAARVVIPGDARDSEVSRNTSWATGKITMYRNRPIANSEYSDCLPTPGTAALASPAPEAAAREATLRDRPRAGSDAFGTGSV